MNGSTLNTKSNIAKNTLLLYGRTLLVMFVTLYTSRVILKALGAEDYGIYHAIAGVVGVASMITGPLAGAISRFITFSLGSGDFQQLKRVYSTAFAVLLIFAGFLVVILESAGVWFLNVKMVIPLERMTAANWILQIAIVTFVINLICVPFSAVITAHEHMSAFAYIGIIDAILKLLVAFLIKKAPLDKLVFYSLLLLAESLIIRIIYSIYCRKNFEECTNNKISIDKEIFKQIFSFTGWSMFGGAASTIHIQGTNMLFNLFGGPIVNAAQAISNQVNSAVNSFVHNFSTALNPSIVKSYASKKFDYMHDLICQGTKFSYFLVLFFAIPISLETETILGWWLGEYPDHTAIFTRLIIMYSLVRSLSNTLITSLNATGIIKNYQIIVGSLLIANLPISYIALKMGAAVEWVLLISIVIEFIALFVRIFLSKKLVGLSIKSFVTKVFILCHIFKYISLSYK